VQFKYNAEVVRKLILLFVAATAVAQAPDGDQHWALRAEGHQGGHAQAAQVDAAIAAYRKAIAQNPNNLEARWKLMRAIRFKGAYVATTSDQKKPIYDEGKKAGEEALAVARGKSGVDVAEINLWDAVNWGEWALAYGKMAAVRQGAADRIKREAALAMQMDPKLEGGAPARVLGRLYNQTPHVPFLTGWASDKEAVRLLNESLKIDPANKITKVFLAEAMVDNDERTKPQAIAMLRDVVKAPNDPDYEVEWAAATDDARKLLKEWGAS
jgi:tetratricopeptide (TPR) repeat protein